MTNEEKLKRIETLEDVILEAKSEILDLKDSLKYQEDTTGRCYRNINRKNLFLEVIDGKDIESCLVLKYEIQDNLCEEDMMEIPNNNEFVMDISLSWMPKRLIGFSYTEIGKEEAEESRQKIIHYMMEHFLVADLFKDMPRGAK